MRTEKIVLNEKRNVTLTAYLQEVGGEFGNIKKRPAILVLPGGGYQMCSDREADPVAMPYLKAGYQAFILRYSVKKDALWPTPLEDYEQAMKLIRKKADEWKLYEDKIAVIGFSAGGHLAASAATMSKNRPNVAILGYAVAGEDVKGCNKSAPDTISAVDKNTCPCFVFATRDDNVVPIENSTRFITALAENDISFESHIYAYGPHGFSTADSSVQSIDSNMCKRVPNWVPDSIGWLRDMFGDFGNGKMTEPKCKRYMNGNYEDFLSIDCTFSYLMDNEEAKAIIEPIVAKMQKEMKKSEEEIDLSEALSGLLANMKLRDMLEFAKLEDEVLEQIDEKLSKIENK